jgi:hypothetical protein
MPTRLGGFLVNYAVGEGIRYAKLWIDPGISVRQSPDLPIAKHDENLLKAGWRAQL